MTPGEFDDLRALLRRQWSSIGNHNQFLLAVCLLGQEQATRVQLLDIKPHGLLFAEVETPNNRGFLPASQITYAIWVNGANGD